MDFSHAIGVFVHFDIDIINKPVLQRDIEMADVLRVDVVDAIDHLLQDDFDCFLPFGDIKTTIAHLTCDQRMGEVRRSERVQTYCLLA